MITDITKFDPLRAELAKYKEQNEILVFDYEDPQGNKDARSHVFKLRKLKTQITEAHREVKAEALAACQAIDGQKRTLIKDVDSMIDVHAEPLRIIKQKEEEASLAIWRAQEEERLAEEARAQKELEDREAKVARKEAEIKAKEDAIKAEQEKVYIEAERAEREKRIAEQAAEDARKQAEAGAAAEKKAIENAAAKKIADAEAEALAKENTRLAKEAADKAEKERLAKIERVRVENIHHRKKIEDGIESVLVRLAGPDAANAVLGALIAGSIPNVTINY